MTTTTASSSASTTATSAVNATSSSAASSAQNKASQSLASILSSSSSWFQHQSISGSGSGSVDRPPLLSRFHSVIQQQFNFYSINNDNGQKKNKKNDLLSTIENTKTHSIVIPPPRKSSQDFTEPFNASLSLDSKEDQDDEDEEVASSIQDEEEEDDQELSPRGNEEDASTCLTSSSASTTDSSSSPTSISLEYLSEEASGTNRIPQTVYELAIGASYLPKTVHYQPSYDCTVLHPDALTFTEEDSGEDACFSTAMPRYTCLGVADGVGGWKSLGVNPAFFARELMMEARDAAEGTLETPLPWHLMEHAFEKVIKNGKVEAGSSTACIVTVDKRDGTLHSANLGDSGYWVFRFKPVFDVSGDAMVEHLDTSPAKSVVHVDREFLPLSHTSPSSSSSSSSSSTPTPVLRHSLTLIHESKENQHYFNAPFQLAIIPPSIPPAKRRFFMADQPSDALRDTFGPLMNGDVIVMGTDGLFDNMFVDEVATILCAELEDVFHSLFDVCVDAAGDRVDEETGVRYTLRANRHGMSEYEWRQFLNQRVQTATESLVKEAAMLSISPRLSPFSKAARSHGWFDQTGGKIDDITVQAALVLAQDHEQPLALL